MELKLTKKQYETLMKLVYLGNWVVNGYKKEDKAADTDHLENYIFAKASDFGLGNLVFYDEELDGYYPSQETEDAWLADFDEFVNDVYWDELMHRLAERDLETRYGQDAVEAMSADERAKLEQELMDKYFAEFQKNGMSNFILYRPS
ncbi:MAG: hypothetical protein FJY82_11265 [Candidatus Aminicenantes bacterium]|nr:hypothetical protein [Candidatus Aminicenantes bacterium]